MFCDFIVERNERPEAWKHRSIQSIAHRFMEERINTHIHEHTPRFFFLHKYFSHVYIFLPHKSVDWQHISDYDCFTLYILFWCVFPEIIVCLFFFNLNSEWRYHGVLFFTNFPLLSSGETCELLTIKLLQCAMGWVGRMRLLLFYV